MDEQYKISLGIDLNTDDLQQQINDAGRNAKPIKLDIEFGDINKDIKAIKTQLEGLGKNGGLTLNTQSLENSLRDIHSLIKDVKASLGSVDGKSGMKSLLSSINAISSALDKASDKFAELNANLNALSGKDLNLNFGINLGGSSPTARNTAYSSKVQNETLPELKKQAKALQDYFKEYYKAQDELSAIFRLAPNRGADILDLYDPMSGYKSKNQKESLINQINAYKRYINIIKEAASLQGIDISHITSGFSKSADQLVQDAQDIQTGAKEVDESFEKLKQIFGGGNNLNIEGLSASLDPIVKDLTAIREAVESLSKGVSVGGLTQSFDRLSETLEKLMTNAKLVQDVLGGSLNGSVSNNGTEKAIQEQNKLVQTSTQAANTVVQSEERKQQAYRETADAIERVAKTKIGDTQLDALNLKDDIDEADRLAAALSKLKNIQSNIKQIKIGEIDTSKGVQELQTLERQLESLSAEYNETVSEINGMGGVSKTQFQSLQNQVNTTGIKLEQLKSKIADTKATLAQKIQLKIDDTGFNGFKQEVRRAHSEAEKLTVSSKELSTALNQLDIAMEAVNSANKADDIEKLIAANTEYELALKSVYSQLKLNQQVEKEAAASQKLIDDRTGFQSKIDSWLTKNSAAAKKYGATLLDLKAKAENCDRTTLNHLEAEFKQVDRAADAAGLKTQKFGDSLKTQFAKYSSYFSVASLFMYAEQGLRSMFEQVKLIDSAMTELKKVTNETDESYNRFLSNAASRSKEIGTTIDGLVSSTADFARLGYGFKDAQGLAEVANIYAVVGDEIDGVEGATESLISTMAAFKDEMNGMSNSDFAMSIVDKFNEIGNNFAISSGGIGEALERSASSLMAANNTIDESIALITAANTVVQDPAQVGRFMPTLKVAISVKLLRRTRPRKDFISIFNTHQLGRLCIFLN